MGDKGIVEEDEALVDDGFHGKNVSSTAFDPRKYTRVMTWFTISHIDEVTSPLRTVSQKSEDELVESLKYGKFQYGIGLTAVANFVSGPVGAVKVDDMPK